MSRTARRDKPVVDPLFGIRSAAWAGSWYCGNRAAGRVRDSLRGLADSKMGTVGHEASPRLEKIKMDLKAQSLPRDIGREAHQNVRLHPFFLLMPDRPDLQFILVDSEGPLRLPDSAPMRSTSTERRACSTNMKSSPTDSARRRNRMIWRRNRRDAKNKKRPNEAKQERPKPAFLAQERGFQSRRRSKNQPKRSQRRTTDPQAYPFSYPSVGRTSPFAVPPL